MKADIGVIEFMRCYFEPEKLNFRHLLCIDYQLLTIKRTLRSRPPFPELVVLGEAAQLSVWSKDCIGENHLRVGQGQSQGKGPLHYKQGSKGKNSKDQKLAQKIKDSSDYAFIYVPDPPPTPPIPWLR